MDKPPAAEHKGKGDGDDEHKGKGDDKGKGEHKGKGEQDKKAPRWRHSSTIGGWSGRCQMLMSLWAERNWPGIDQVVDDWNNNKIATSTGRWCDLGKKFLWDYQHARWYQCGQHIDTMTTDINKIIEANKHKTAHGGYS